MSTTKLVHLTTPLAPDQLLPYKMTATEELGRLFRYELELLSPDPAIKLEDLLGKPMSVSVDLPDGKTRWFNGLVTRFAYTGRVGRWAKYEATLRPWLWFLTRAQDCRIFGNGSEGSAKPVPDIVKQVFRKHGFSDFKEKLQGSYLPRTYCVQYRESDFDFVSRLLEEEGIYYGFRHEEGKHTLEFFDAPGSHEALEAYAELPFIPPSEQTKQREDHIYEWFLTQEVQSGGYETKDFEFVTPLVDLTSTISGAKPHPYGAMQVYDPPGGYVEPYEVAGGDGSDKDAQDRGRAYSKLRLEEMLARYEIVHGMGNATGLAAGDTFTLKDHSREDQNGEYLVLSTRHELQVAGYEGLQDGLKETVLQCGFTLMPSDVPFRPARVTPRPMITGPQTATVTGKSGEEIWTDKHGRVKVHFHWDRLNSEDENSSCWMRVAQVWAGQNWGGVTIPRMGQEVIVEFLEGDPDRPIVTGRVYNGKQTHPYGLPESATQSGLKSRSSKGGGPANFNELRFEDKKGSEQVYLHAEKDQSNVVENDMATSVGHDQTLVVGHDQTNTIHHDMTSTVDNNQVLHVKVNQTETVDGNQSITVNSNRDEHIVASRSLAVGANKSETVGGNKTIGVSGDNARTIGGSDTLTVSGARTMSISGKLDETVAGAMSVTVANKFSQDVLLTSSLTAGVSVSTTAGTSVSTTAGTDIKHEANGGVSIAAGKGYALKAADDIAGEAGKKIMFSAADEITIGTGDASITLKKDGTITIKGKDITVQGSGKINVKADSDVIMKGSKVLAN